MSDNPQTVDALADEYGYGANQIAKDHTGQAKDSITIPGNITIYNPGEMSVTIDEDSSPVVIPHIPIKFKKLPHYRDLPELTLATPGSVAVDLYAAIDLDICLNTIGSSAIIPTGFSLEIPIGFEVLIRPRSGLAAKDGITVLNSPGTIDSDYRGEIKVILIKLTTKKFFIKRGMRIAQMVVKPVYLPSFKIVTILSETERNDGGFGSTGT